MPMQKGSSWNSPLAGSVVNSRPPILATKARQAAPAPASTAPRPASTTTRSAPASSFAAPATSSGCGGIGEGRGNNLRSEEHTSELQSRLHLVCRLLLEKKKKNKNTLSENYTQATLTPKLRRS